MNSEQDVVEADWDRFASLDRLINHWQQPGWQHGKRAYYWYLTFGDSPSLRKLAMDCQTEIAAPYLDPINLDELHMTLDRIGFEADLNDNDICSIESAAESACKSIESFTLAAGPLAGSSGAIRFSTTPWEPILRVREALRQAIAAKVPRVEFETGTFNPHIGIAYCNSDIPAEPVIKAVRPMRKMPKATVSVERVSLVLLERRECSWRWTTRRSFPLAQSRSNQQSTRPPTATH